MIDSQKLAIIRDFTDSQKYEFEYGYIYDLDQVSKNLLTLQSSIQPVTIYLDPSYIPDKQTLTHLSRLSSHKYICSNKFQSEFLKMIEISQDKIITMLPPSKQPTETNYNSFTLYQCSSFQDNAVLIVLSTQNFLSWSPDTSLLEKNKRTLVVRLTDIESHEHDLPQIINKLVSIQKTTSLSVGIDLTPLVVKNSCFFLFKTIYTKTNHEHNYAICSAGTNFLYSAGMGLNPRKHKFKIYPLSQQSNTNLEPWTFTGPLCTPGDILAIKYMVNKPKPGDFFCIPCDRYEIHYSPTQFISHSSPKKYYLHKNSVEEMR